MENRSCRLTHHYSVRSYLIIFTYPIVSFINTRLVLSSIISSPAELYPFGSILYRLAMSFISFIYHTGAVCMLFMYSWLSSRAAKSEGKNNRIFLSEYSSYSAFSRTGDCSRNDLMSTGFARNLKYSSPDIGVYQVSALISFANSGSRASCPLARIQLARTEGSELYILVPPIRTANTRYKLFSASFFLGLVEMRFRSLP